MPGSCTLRRARPLAGALMVLPLWAALALSGGVAPVAAQQAPTGDLNVVYPIEYIEQRLRAPTLVITDMERIRVIPEDRSRRVTLAGQDGEPDMDVHWKPVAPPGSGFNNEPRYEVAAYRFQKLFLDESEYVVPPTVIRAMPIEEYRQYRTASAPTIRGTRSVVFLLSYWIHGLASDTVDPYNEELFERDEVYARHFGNANILTHLIDHKDGNHGNVLLSLDGLNRRVFAVDNDVAFRSQASRLGTRWRSLLVTRLPATTIERLRAITAEDLERELGVVAEFELVGGVMVPVEHGRNLAPTSGVRVSGGRVQFGLTRNEIRDVERRIEQLLREVDRGRITTF